ncbi:entericidin A anti-toxin [Bordetella ansorpii]|nr:entericidin A/B family lipoprotein [Bordetella ansorpii]SAH81791.1 entericidin A anti-toxin [Bordetella ansorpii]
MKHSRKLLAAVLAMAAMVAGCNTMEGAGKDIERGGEKIQDSAR